jgi:hypothetical protein
VANAIDVRYQLRMFFSGHRQITFDFVNRFGDDYPMIVNSFLVALNL